VNTLANSIRKTKTALLALSLGFALYACDATQSDNDNEPQVVSNDGGTGDEPTPLPDIVGERESQDADPVAIDFPIAYIARPLPREMDEDVEGLQALVPSDVLNPLTFNPGARLVFKSRASVTAETTIISDAAFLPVPIEDDEEAPTEEAPIIDPATLLYDIRDLNVSADGSKLVFAMRAPADPDAGDDEQPTWNIWEYDLEEEMLSRFIESNIVAEAGEDVHPAYLPDGSIVFSSTRQSRSKAVLLDEGKPRFAAVAEGDDESHALLLHVMKKTLERGFELEQITYNQSHDIQPSVLGNGRILFTRWDNFLRDRGNDTSANNNRLSLYSVNPNGSDLTLMYGFHSPDTINPTNGNAYIKPKELPDGRILVSYRQRESNNQGGDLVAIDINNYIDINTPIFSNQGATDPGQETITINRVITDEVSASPHGYFSSAHPLFDDTNRFLTSWSPCLVQGFQLGIYVRSERNLDTGEVNNTRELINAFGEFVDRNGNRLEPIPDPDADPDVNPGATIIEVVTVEPEEISAFPCNEDTLSNPDIALPTPRYGIWVYNPNDGTQSPVVLSREEVMYTEAVVFEPRQAPDFIPGPDLSDSTIAQWANEKVGVLDIRSVYDLDGFDITESGISTMADPAQTPPDSRPARFIRILKAVSIPHEDEFEVDLNLARGRNGRAVKDIIGYAPIHPDGSAMFKVPADVAFSLSIVDGNGRRVSGTLGAEHRNWLTLRPGELRTCNGCHASASTAPHGRSDAQAESINPGALAEVAFTNTRLLDEFDTPLGPPLVGGSDESGVSGETMAQYFVRVKTTNDRDPLTPSVDIVWRDEWTDTSIAGLSPGTNLSMRYGSEQTRGPDDLQTKAPVSLDACLDGWQSQCRITVSYEEHIQPIWDRPRSRINETGATVNTTCSSCHNNQDSEGDPQIPAPADALDFTILQLDLSASISREDDMDYYSSYDHLFANNKTLMPNPLNTTQLIDATARNVDEDNNPLFLQVQLEIDGVEQFQALDINNVIVPAPADTMDVTLTLLLEDPDDENSLIPYLTDRLDAVGSPIPDFSGDLVRSARYLNDRGANQNDRFFSTFRNGDLNHRDQLSPVELKLISEWLDVGGQYYNDPFDTLDD